MLAIREAQVKILEKARRRDFEDRLLAIIAAEYPASYKSLEEKGVRELINRAIVLGEANRIRTEGGVTSLTGLIIQYGESFEHSPEGDWARGVLAHPTMPEQLKLDILLEQMAGRTRGRIVVPQGAK